MVWTIAIACSAVTLPFTIACLQNDALERSRCMQFNFGDRREVKHDNDMINAQNCDFELIKCQNEWHLKRITGGILNAFV